VVELSLSAGSGMLGGSGTADVQRGKLIFDYTSTTNDPAAVIEENLVVGYAHHWASGRIHSSTAASGGYALGWLDDTASQRVTIAYTLPGNANLDETVNISDLNKVLTNFDKTGMTWANGDFDYNGTVDISDLNKVLTNFDKSVGTPGAMPGESRVAESNSPAAKSLSTWANMVPGVLPSASKAKLVAAQSAALNSGKTSPLPCLADYDRVLHSQAWDGSTGSCDWLDGLIDGLANGGPAVKRHDVYNWAVDAAMADSKAR
jgi:hypothetical protein